MPEKIFVRYCSPTLAGIKTANLFSYCFKNKNEMRESVRGWNAALVKKGVRVLPLAFRGGRALIYVYRPSKLKRDLQRADVCSLLKKRGYVSEEPERCIVQLMRRLIDGGEFPHEIGLFLGYPPEDVRGFIENKATGYKCIGEWKVYGDVERAKKTFEQYKKCTEVYCALFAQGKSMEQLTVAV